MKTDVTTSIILEKRRKRKNGFYPLKLRITCKRYSKYYSLGYALSPLDFDRLMQKSPRGNFKEIKIKVQEIENKAIRIIHDLDEFTFEEFELQFFDKKIHRDIFSLFANKIDFLKNQSRIKTARSNQNTLTTLKLFYGKSKLEINKVNKSFLEDFENWMISNGKSITTVGIYCRNIRAVFNDAIAGGFVKSEAYPFGRKKYQIPTGLGIKKALSKEDVLKLVGYKPIKEIEAYSRDMWLFSYLANGMNFTDIANLEPDNLDGDFIIFIRSKTIRSTRSKPILIKVFITDKMKEIMAKWGNFTDRPFIFPILNEGMDSEQKANKIELAIRSINHHIGKIAKSVGIQKKVTTYTARHTFSTVLKRSGASIEFISESLGHSNIITTKSYLDSFEDDEKKKWSEKLL